MLSNRGARHPEFPVGGGAFFKYYIIFNSICQIPQHMRVPENARGTFELRGGAIRIDLCDAGGNFFQGVAEHMRSQPIRLAGPGRGFGIQGN